MKQNKAQTAEDKIINDCLKGCEHDGSYIPVSEVRRVMLKALQIKEQEVRIDCIAEGLTKGYITSDKIIEKAKQQGKQEAIKDEIEFLESDKIKWLIHEADLGSCHEDYEPVKKRLQSLKEKMK